MSKKIHKDEGVGGMEFGNLYWKKNSVSVQENLANNHEVIDRVRSTLSGMYDDKLNKNRMSLKDRAEQLIRNSIGGSSKKRIDGGKEKSLEISGKKKGRESDRLIEKKGRESERLIEKKGRESDRLIESSFVKNLEKKLSKVENGLNTINATQTQEPVRERSPSKGPARLSQRDVDIKGSSRWSKLNFLTRKPSTGQNNPLEITKDLTPNANSRIEDYEFVGKTLGEGGFAVVRMAYYRKSREKFAIKSFNRLKMSSTSRLKQIKSEFDILMP